MTGTGSAVGRPMTLVRAPVGTSIGASVVADTCSTIGGAVSFARLLGHRVVSHREPPPS